MIRRSIAAWFWLFAALVGVAAVIALRPPGERSWLLVANSAQLAAATCLWSVPAGTVLALLLARTDLPGRRAATLLMAWLLFIPLYVQVGAWQAGFGLQGWQTLSGLGPAWLDGWRGAVTVHAAAAIPWVALIVAIGLRTIRPELEEAALLDTSQAGVLCHVTLRHAAPLVVAAVLWVAISTAGEIAVTDLFQIRTYAEELYTEAAIGGNPGEAPLRAMPGIAIIGWMALGALVALWRLASADRSTPTRPPLQFALGRWKWLLAVCVWIAMALLVGLPLVSLAWKSGVEVLETASGRERHWSLVKCVAVVGASPLRYRRETVQSLFVGCAAATATVAVAIALVWKARRSRVAAAALVTTVVGGLALPGPVVGLIIIWFFNRPAWAPALYLYDRTIVPPVVAQMVRALPVVCLMLWYALHTIPREEIEAAELDGARSWGILRYVVLPQRLAAVAVAWLSAFAISIGEMAATILVAPPGIEPLSVRISGLLHYGVEDQVAGICLALGLVFLAVSAAVAVLSRRWLLSAGGRRPPSTRTDPYS